MRWSFNSLGDVSTLLAFPCFEALEGRVVTPGQRVRSELLQTAQDGDKGRCSHKYAQLGLVLGDGDERRNRSEQVQHMAGMLKKESLPGPPSLALPPWPSLPPSLPPHTYTRVEE